jgi:hypothetical protein
MGGHMAAEVEREVGHTATECGGGEWATHATVSLGSAGHWQQSMEREVGHMATDSANSWQATQATEGG